MITLLRFNETGTVDRLEAEDSLSTYQKMVKGWIETAPVPDREDAVFIVNEEGKLRGMKPTLDVGYDVLCGPVLLVGIDNETGEFCSTPDDLVEELAATYEIRDISFNSREQGR